MQKVLSTRIVIISLLIAISMLIISVPAFAATTGAHTPVEDVTV